jgi:hypothetical protein
VRSAVERVGTVRGEKRADRWQGVGNHRDEHLEGATGHDARGRGNGTFGSWLALAGVPLRTIQKLMGHKSITTTERYAHLSRENLAIAVRTLEAFGTKSVTSSERSQGSVDSRKTTESGQVHGILRVPAALLTDAGVVKLADARDSKSRGVHSP